MIGVIAIILVLAGLIFFHELGHFLAARAMGIGVRTFSIGFGKALVSWQGRKTRYQISMIPLGGYVDLVGMSKEDVIEPPFTQNDSYGQKSPARRLVTVAAGPLFNIVLAWFIYWGLLWSGAGLVLPEVGDLKPGSPAVQAGILPGDMIKRVGEVEIRYWDDVLFNVQRSQGESMEVAVTRNGYEHVFNIKPEVLSGEDDKGKPYKVYLLGVVASGRLAERGFLESAGDGFKEAWSKTTLIVKLVAQMFSREGSVTENLGGPVLVAQTVHQQATAFGLTGVLKITALLSINLGLLNLLPIPALDGGHVLFNIIEWVARRPVPERIQAIFTYCGFIFLIGVMVMATALDVFRMVG